MGEWHSHSLERDTPCRVHRHTPGTQGTAVGTVLAWAFAWGGSFFRADQKARFLGIYSPFFSHTNLSKFLRRSTINMLPWSLFPHVSEIRGKEGLKKYHRPSLCTYQGMDFCYCWSQGKKKTWKEVSQWGSVRSSSPTWGLCIHADLPMSPWGGLDVASDVPSVLAEALFLCMQSPSP